MSDKLTKIEPQQGGLSVEQVFQAVIEKQISVENIEVMKQLLAISAEQKFNEAFVRLQSQLPVIVASSSIPNRGKYERYEDIMDKDGVGKILADNGFTVSFDQDFKDNRIIATCKLSHVGGHTRPNRYTTRVGGKADSDTQADSKASTTAKRNALIQALNLTIRQDCLNEENDVSLEGNPDEFVTKEQAGELERRVAETNSDKTAFLKFANSEKFATIQANRYHDLNALLARKERAGR
jgi:hypothetical protein